MDEFPDTEKVYNIIKDINNNEIETEELDPENANGIYFLLILSVLIIFALSFISI